MEEYLDVSHNDVFLVKELYNGSYIYKDQNNYHYNEHGVLIHTPKFESLLERNSNYKTKEKGKEKEKEKEKGKEKGKGKGKEMPNTDMMDGAYEFTSRIVELMNQKFNGMELGSEEFNTESIMNELWADYKPGEKKVKKAKKVKKGPPSGYIHFGKVNKEKFLEMMKGDEGSKFVTIAAKEWKKLSNDEKVEWDKKAKDSYKEENEDTSNAE